MSVEEELIASEKRTFVAIRERDAEALAAELTRGARVMRPRLLLALALFSAAGSALAADAPRHVIYLHGRIVQEQQSARPRNERFGYYELEAILNAFRKEGFSVTGDIRSKAATPGASADIVVKQVRELLAKGVAADHVAVVGASMGGGIALLASARLQQPAVRFAVMGVCLSQNVMALQREEGKAPAGRLLAIREGSDEYTQGCPDWKANPVAPKLQASEIVLHTGLSHGFLYRPMPEWTKPVLAFVAEP